MSEDRDWEGEARREGWRPQEEWKGNPEQWKDPKTFVEDGEKIASIQRSKVERLESELTDTKKAINEFKTFHEKALAKERKEAQKRIAELEAARAEAISDGDGQRFTKIDREIQDLHREVSSPEPQGQFATPPEWKDFYNVDDDMTIYADGIASRVADEGFQGQAFINEVARRVKSKFSAPAPAPSQVEAPSNAPASTGSNGWDNLPSEDRAQAERFISQGILTKEQFLEQYDWD